VVIILITATIITITTTAPLAIILITVVVLEAEDPKGVPGAEDVEDPDRTKAPYFARFLKGRVSKKDSAFFYASSCRQYLTFRPPWFEEQEVEATTPFFTSSFLNQVGRYHSELRGKVGYSIVFHLFMFHLFIDILFLKE
jgi:hypothetical protein